jgi:hypothetical protein
VQISFFFPQRLRVTSKTFLTYCLGGQQLQGEVSLNKRYLSRSEAEMESRMLSNKRRKKMSKGYSNEKNDRCHRRNRKESQVVVPQPLLSSSTFHGNGLAYSPEYFLSTDEYFSPDVSPSAPAPAPPSSFNSLPHKQLSPEYFISTDEYESPKVRSQPLLTNKNVPIVDRFPSGCVTANHMTSFTSSSSGSLSSIIFDKSIAGSSDQMETRVTLQQAGEGGGPSDITSPSTIISSKTRQLGVSENLIVVDQGSQLIPQELAAPGVIEPSTERISQRVEQTMAFPRPSTPPFAHEMNPSESPLFKVIQSAIIFFILSWLKTDFRRPFDVFVRAKDFRISKVKQFERNKLKPDFRLSAVEFS